MAVVEDVVVAERGALGKAGGPARVLDVDRVVKVELRESRRKLVGRWARAGETVIIGSREASRAREAAVKLQTTVGDKAKVSGEENRAACATAEIIVLTIPFEGHCPLLKQVKSAIRPGSIVVDTTVPLAASVGGRATRTLGIWEGSAAQQAAELVPPGVSVVAAFHNTSADILNGEDAVDCDVIVCSDDAAALQTVRTLASKIPGVRAIDVRKFTTLSCVTSTPLGAPVEPDV